MPEFAALQARARALGYGLQTVLAADCCPELAHGFSAIWLLANTGDAVQQRWLAGESVAHKLQQDAHSAPHSAGPLDDFCRAELGTLLATQAHHWLFPQPYGEPLAPLVKWLQAAGWWQPGPFMNSLHPRYGSWWAVRAVIALDAAPSGAQPAFTAQPCLDCPAPCVNACPAQAVAYSRAWDWQRCGQYRLAQDSACTSDCLARLACPLGAEWRYHAAVREYHYRASLPSLQRYFAPPSL